MGLFLLRLIVDDVLIFFVPLPVPLLLLGLIEAVTASDSSFALGESDFIDSNGFVNSKETQIYLQILNSIITSYLWILQYSQLL